MHGLKHIMMRPVVGHHARQSVSLLTRQDQNNGSVVARSLT